MPPTSGVRVTLDKERALRYTNRAMVALEDQAGEPVGAVLARFQAGAFRARTLVVWAGLLHAEPDLTVDEVIDRIDIARVADISAKAWDALAKDLGEGEDEGNAEAATEPKE